MFDKLKNLFDNTPDREFIPRDKVTKRDKPDASVSVDMRVERGDSNGNINKGTLIGADPFNRKSDISEQSRIESKIELLRKLQREINGE